MLRKCRQTDKGVHHPLCVIADVTAAHEDQQSPNRAASQGHALPCRAELFAQNGVPRAEQTLARGRNEVLIAVFCMVVAVLIEQQIAVMRPIRQIVYDHQVPPKRLCRLFPQRIQGVVIDDQPVEGPSAGTCLQAGSGIFKGGCSEPGGMPRRRIVRGLRWRGRNRGVQLKQLESQSTQFFLTEFRQIAEHEDNPAAPLPQGNRQRPATHIVPGTYLR